MSIQHTVQMISKSVFGVLSARALAVTIPIPVNPPKIVTMGEDEFTIDLHEMDRWTPYVVVFQGSKYAIWKNDDDALVMIDVEMLLGSKPDDG